jgi:hypothetical protein
MSAIGLDRRWPSVTLVAPRHRTNGDAKLAPPLGAEDNLTYGEVKVDPAIHP